MTKASGSRLIDAPYDYLDRCPSVHGTEKDLAAAAGVDVQELGQAFYAKLQTSPNQSTRRHRRDRVQRYLLNGDPSMLTAVNSARRWGFVHLSRFFLAYEARHGETPEQTLSSLTPSSSAHGPTEKAERAVVLHDGDVCTSVCTKTRKP